MALAALPTLTIVSGSPGTGKTTLARSLAGLAPRGVHIVSDDFFAFIVDLIVPSLRDARAQNETVAEAVVRAAIAFARGAYDVVLDGIIVRKTLDFYRHEFAAAGIAVDYIVLRAPLAETIRRITLRPDQPVSEDVIRAMHPKFADLGAFERHAVDTAGVPAEVLLSDVSSKLRDGYFRLS